MLAIYWILVVPQVDLDPAPPLNLEVFFFAIVAISVLLGVHELGRLQFRKLMQGVIPLAQAPPMLFAAGLSPLRL